MENTQRFNLPYIMPSQAQKHVTHNEAVRLIDGLLHIHLVDIDANTPPTAPVEGHAFGLGNAPTGNWAQQAGQIAIWQDGAWAFCTPVHGMVAWVAAQTRLMAFTNSGWAEAVGSLTQLGINASASDGQRLSMASTESVFSHDGSSHQMSINKAVDTETAALVFKNNWVGHAEMGLVGDNNFTFKTSADGLTFKSAIHIDATTGNVGIGGTARTDAVLHVDGNLNIAKSGWISSTIESIGGTNTGSSYVLRTGGDSWAISHRGQNQSNELWFMFNNGSRTYLTTEGGWQFQSVGTTAAGANAVLDPANRNALLRSTSSAQYKTDIEPVDADIAFAILEAQPVWYRSRCKADRADWSWYGFVAEDVAKIDPRLVHWGRAEADEGRENAQSELQPQGVAYDRFVVIHHQIIKDILSRLARLELVS